MTEPFYTIRQAAEQVGRSVGWLRGHIRRGNLHPQTFPGKFGPEYRFSPADIQDALSLLPINKSGVVGVAEAAFLANRAANASLALREQVADLQRENAALDARVLELDRRDQEQITRIADLEARYREAQTRIETLKALTWLDRLRGRQKAV